MTRNPSKLATELAVDDPLLQDANFEFDADDRQYIDNQIRACQGRIVDLYSGGSGRLSVLTTGATPLRVRRYAIANGAVLSLRGIVTVQSTNGSGAVRGEWEIASCHGVVGGTLAAEYAPVITELFSVGSPVPPTITKHGNSDVDVNVTGLMGTGLTWKVYTTIL